MTALKLTAFAVLATVITLYIAGTIRPIGQGDTNEYSAVFSNASSLTTGDQVRVAGVVVGQVTDVSVDSKARAVVRFTAADDLGLTTGTRAHIRYLNLVGKRYLALLKGKGQPLRDKATIALDRTQPALDLDLLFNGFKPLFAALSPDDVNALSRDIVATLQGEAGTISDLLDHTASLTATVADRDVVIGRLIKNLDAVLGTVAARESGVNNLVVQLDRYVAGLADDRELIGQSLVQLDALASDTAGLLREVRSPLRTDVKQLRTLVGKLDRPVARRVFDRNLRRLPDKLTKATRVASYGSFFNFHVCDASLSLVAPQDAAGLPPELLALLGQSITGTTDRVSLHDPSDRCVR